MVFLGCSREIWFPVIALVFFVINGFMFLGLSNKALTVTNIPSSRQPNELYIFNSNNSNHITELSKNETGRIGCRTFPKGGETCAFSGIACVDMDESLNENNHAGNIIPQVYFVHDGHNDGAGITHDNWCGLRYRSADPSYFGPREWPPVSEVVSPRWSCLKAKWRTSNSLFRNKSKPVTIKWVPDLSIINLDYERNSHNNHYLMDLVWLLDLRLWKNSLSVTFTQIREIFSEQTNFMFPQSREDFIEQTATDINRLLFTLIFGLNSSKLYLNQTRDTETQKIETRPLLESYPILSKKIIFARKKRKKSEKVPNSKDLICTRKLFAGAKLGNMGHERVCSYIRESSFELFGIQLPEKNYPNTGYLWIEQAPRRVILLQRHITRGFENYDELVKSLNRTAARYDFEFELHSTGELKTAEDNVRFFSRAGVILTTHGSQSMGVMWMPRHSALIEVFPPAYHDYSFKILSDTCNVQYFELYGKIRNELKPRYRRECIDKFDSHYSQCNSLKSEAILADIPATIDTVLIALRKIGHEIPLIDLSSKKEKDP